jgi:hypothetical protein
MAAATPVEPIADAVHLSIDMQNIFAPGGLWETPWMERGIAVDRGHNGATHDTNRFHSVHHTAAYGGSARAVDDRSLARNRTASKARLRRAYHFLCLD